MRNILAFVFLLIYQDGFTQSSNSIQLASLSGFTQKFLYESERSGSEIVPGYVYKEINNKRYISAIARVAAGFNEEELNSKGVLIGTRAGSIYTLQIPLEVADIRTIL